MTVITIQVNQFLPMGEDVGTEPTFLFADDFLSFAETVKISPISISVTQILNLQQDYLVRTSIKNISLSQNLSLESIGAKGPYYSHIDIFFLYHEGKIVKHEHVIQQLSFTQSFIEIRARNGTNTLSFTETINVNIIRNISVTQQLVLQSLASIYNLKCDFISTGQVALTSPDHINLTYTPLNLNLNLRNPNFGDGIGNEISRINRKTRGNDLKIYRDTNWPRMKILRYQFTYLKQSEIEQLFHFMKSTLGKEIQLTDYEGRVWIGVIRTPAANAIQQGRFNFQFDLEFEGELQ